MAKGKDKDPTGVCWNQTQQELLQDAVQKDKVTLKPAAEEAPDFRPGALFQTKYDPQGK